MIGIAQQSGPKGQALLSSIQNNSSQKSLVRHILQLFHAPQIRTAVEIVAIVPLLSVLSIFCNAQNPQEAFAGLCPPDDRCGVAEDLRDRLFIKIYI